MEAEALQGTTTYWTFAASSGVPYVYPSTGGAATGDAVIALDNVFSGTPTLPQIYGLFSVQSATQPNLPFKIVAASAGIWNFNPATRTLRADFDALLAGLEALGLKPGRLGVIRGLLSQALPQTFAETLYVRYGLDPANRCVDVVPGMRLRLDFQVHQAVDPEASARNGFVGSGTSYIEIAQSPNSQYGVATTFDPFLSLLQGFSVPAAQGGAGGLVDVQSVLRMPYARLLYPATFTSSDGTGAVGPQSNAVLIGAPTWAALVSATTTYVQQQTVSAPAWTFFRGRTAAVPEIPVYIQGERQFVTLGTTLRGLLAGVGPVPWLAGGKVQVSSGLSFSRSWTPLSMLVGAPSWAPGTFGNVNFTGSYGSYGDNLDSFDLPLLGGDRFMLPISG